MLPPVLPPPVVAAGAPDDFLSPLPLLLHAARTVGAAADSAATPAIPFRTERRIGGTETSGAGFVSLSRMAASIAAQTVSHEIHQEQSQQRLAPGECQPSVSHIW